MDERMFKKKTLIYRLLIDRTDINKGYQRLELTLFGTKFIKMVKLESIAKKWGSKHLPFELDTYTDFND